MNIKKRCIVIVLLIIFICFIVYISNCFEEKLYIKNELEILNNKYTVFKDASNFKISNQERYVNYYEKHKNLNYEDIVTYVNIGLDKPYYSYVSNADTKKRHLILVNKYNKLSKEYIPNDLESIDKTYFINGNSDVNMLKKEARKAFEKLSYDSIKNNTPVYGQSAYRSYERQVLIYDDSLKLYGKDRTDVEVARPGFSEHQTGLAIDVSSNKYGNMLSFINTSSYLWMINNCYKYGFILRYDKNKEKIHGYIDEPWHYRYVGKKIALDMYKNYSNLTYDEYYYKFIENKKD